MKPSLNHRIMQTVRCCRNRFSGQTENETVLITGASAGIGRACAIQFAKHGKNLVLVARSTDKLQALQQELEHAYPISVTVLPMDLLQPDAALALQKELQRRHIVVDILINNAGYGDFAPFLDADWDKQKNMVQLNITALMQMTYVFGNEMKAHGHGHIVNLSSVAAFFAGPYMSVYYASKAFVRSFSEAVAEELNGTGVTVTAFCPGPTATSFGQAADMDHSNMFTFHKPQTAEAVAKAIYRSCRSKQVLYYHSAVTKFSSIGARFAPRALTRRITKQINGNPNL